MLICRNIFLISFLIKILLSSVISHEQKDEFQSFQFQHAIHKINTNYLLNNSNQNEYLKYFENEGDLEFNVYSIVKHVLLNYEKSELNISSSCKIETKFLINGIKHRELWVFKMFDSFGKIPSGISYGDINWLGEFDECRNISAYKGNFKGKYTMYSKPDNLNTGVLLMLKFRYGFCVPHHCSRDDVVKIINYGIGLVPTMPKFIHFPFHLKPINSSDIQTYEQKKLDLSAIITLSIIAIFISLVIVGTLYDIFRRFRQMQQSIIRFESFKALENEEEEQEEREITVQDEFNLIDKKIEMISDNFYYENLKNDHIFFQILVSFSAYSNTKKLFKINDDNQEFKCLHGIRVISLCWVILGHTYVFAIFNSDNILLPVEWIKRFSFLIVSNAFFSVDSFFLLSGFLTAFTFLKYTSYQNLSITFIFKYYLHRFWRLSPPYFICLLILANLSMYFGDGPLFPSQGLDDNCKKYWYLNVLYLSNIDADKVCFPVSWFLSNDMQFHWIAPLVLIPVALKKLKIGLTALLLLLLINIMVIIGILCNNPGMETAQFGLNFLDYFQQIYIKPWARISPYLIGLALAYLIFVIKKGFQINVSKKLNFGLWFLGISLMSLCVFGLYPDVDGNPLSRPVHIIYQAFSKIAWSLGLSYIIFACITLRGGIINKLLSWSFWIPLSRISYSTFLVHLTFIRFFYTSRSHQIHIEDLTMATLFISNVVFSYSIGYVFNIFFEVPLIGLEKFLFKNRN